MYFVNLSAVHDPDQVLPALAQTLGLQNGTRPLFKGLQTALYHRQLLLLLDNFEQVVQSAPLLTDLLVSCRGVYLLVTSREPLHIEGEHEFPVPPLPLPSRQGGQEKLEANPAVTLFLQRARAIH